MTTAFVTGATGFLGEHLCRVLTQRGVHVHASRLDVTDANAIQTAIRAAAADWVFHLAARVRDGDLTRVNVTGTENVLRAANAKAFVAVGSFEEYGDNPAPFREDMLARPRSPYGISKATATQLVVSAGHSVVRLPVVYGPGQSPDTFIGGACAAVRAGDRFAMTAGEQTRDFLYVDDAVNALVTTAERIESCRGEILNACTGIALTLRQAVHMIAEIVGLPDFADIGARPYRANEQMHYVGDATKIAHRTGWKPQTTFADGVRLTLQSS